MHEVAVCVGLVQKHAVSLGHFCPTAVSRQGYTLWVSLTVAEYLLSPWFKDFYLFTRERERERERERMRYRQNEKERENLRKTPFRAWSLVWGPVPGS